MGKWRRALIQPRVYWVSFLGRRGSLARMVVLTRRFISTESDGRSLGQGCLMEVVPVPRCGHDDGFQDCTDQVVKLLMGINTIYLVHR